MREASPRLGRGLAALLGDAQGNSPAEVAFIETTNLDPNPFQPRGPLQDGDLDELVASIRSQGVLQPILVRRHPADRSRFQIVAGERRWRATRLAGLTEIPCFVRDMSDADASAAALVENLQREDLNPIEEAEGFRRLIADFSLTQDDLATAIGKSRSHVANLLRLLKLPAAVIGHVRAGTLTAGHGRAALACADPEAAAATMIARGLSVRQAEALPTQPHTAHRERPPVTHQVEGAADLRAVERDLTEHLGLHVAISFNGRGGTVSLRYQTLDQLDHIIARLGSR